MEVQTAKVWKWVQSAKCVCENRTPLRKRFARVPGNNMEEASIPSTASLRSAILRRALPSSSSSHDGALRKEIERVSRKLNHDFNLVPWELLKSKEEPIFSANRKDTCGNRDAVVCYTLPIGRAPTLRLAQRLGCHVELRDFEISSTRDIDSTGLVCLWPSEEVLMYYCLTGVDIFGTFFKEFHADLAYTMRYLLRNSENSLGIFFSPSRGRQYIGHDSRPSKKSWLKSTDDRKLRHQNFGCPSKPLKWRRFLSARICCRSLLSVNDQDNFLNFESGGLASCRAGSRRNPLPIQKHFQFKI